MINTTKKILVIALFLIFASALVFVFMVYQVIEHGEQLTNQTVLLNKENAQADSYAYMHKLSLETVDERDFLKSYFLEKEGSSIDFLNYVETLAKETSIDLKTSELDTVDSKGDEPKWIETTFSIEASREKIQQFIKILETVPYVSRITDIKMSSKVGDEWKASVTMRVMVLGYDE